MTKNLWIRRLHPKPQAQLRLFCLPHAGGSASLFHLWAQGLPDSIEVCPIQLPGRESRLREKAFQEVPALVEALLAALPPYLGQPYAFFGHSMGSLISYELTRRLRQQGYPEPSYLLVSGRRAPHLPDPLPPLHHLPDADFIASIQQRYQGVPDLVLQNAEMLSLFLPILRADFTLVETYQHQHTTPLTCPIVAFGGQDDDSVTQTELAAWQVQTQGSFALQMLPGDHFYLQQPEPLLQAISHQLFRQ